MTRQDDDHRTPAFASPPCFMHELDPDYLLESNGGDPVQQTDLKRWRKAERERLIEARLAIDVETRRRHDAMITKHLETIIGPVEGTVVSAYWPFRGEPNLLPFVKAIEAGGGRCALPAVVARGKPLLFRAWSPGDPLARGVWNIPAPREGAPIVVPDVIVAPVVGFDQACFRLGYGGGYYDRTLAALANRPRFLGIGYASAALRTIYPQCHDVRMDAVITEAGVVSSPLESEGA